MGRYDEVLRASVTDPEGFWLSAAGAIDWSVPPVRALDSSEPPFYRWFPDGRLNVAYNAVDRHVEAGRGEQAAVIYDSPVTGMKRTLSYRKLRDEVALFAGVLAGLGVGKGDRVLIYMPMIPQAIIAMLGCARLGAVHSVVFGGFAPKELALRIDDATPKVIVSASFGIEGKKVIGYLPRLNRAIELAQHRPAKRVIVQRRAEAVLGPDDINWTKAMASATPVDPVMVAATDPLYILYTSGTTGRPKGVVRDSGGHAVALAWSMSNVYDIGAGETMFTASDLGWVVGHSYTVYGPLLVGATTVLFEGEPVGTPDAGQFWRIASEYRVKTIFAAPTALRTIRKRDPHGSLLAGYDLSALKYLFLAGERLEPQTYRWATDLLGVPVIDHWWQTESGWPIVANPAGIEVLPLKPGSPSRPLPGWDVRVLAPDGTSAPAGQDGAIVIKLPMPPGALPRLWNDDARFLRSYLAAFPGYYLTGDGGHLDADGYLYVMGRTDDVINVAGNRLSTGAMEDILASHPDVAECAVFGVADAIDGQIPRGLVVLRSDVPADEVSRARLCAELVQMVRDQIGAVTGIRQVDIVAALPRTRSGKILRATMSSIADGRAAVVPPTIADASVLGELRPVLRPEPRLAPTRNQPAAAR
ncbi:MAG TPA: AMP-binding protein [Nakamurella sp.]|nr:AMP-binding protein [Nakamurella sp.]